MPGSRRIGEDPLGGGVFVMDGGCDLASGATRRSQPEAGRAVMNEIGRLWMQHPVGIPRRIEFAIRSESIVVRQENIAAMTVAIPRIDRRRAAEKEKRIAFEPDLILRLPHELRQETVVILFRPSRSEERRVGKECR